MALCCWPGNAGRNRSWFESSNPESCFERGADRCPADVVPLAYDQFIESSRKFPTYVLDIETDTTVDGLDPEVSPIVAVAVTGPNLEQVLDGPEVSILTALESLMRSLPPGVMITWNGTRFDLPFIARRAEIAGVALGLTNPSGRAEWHGHIHLDGYLLYRADVGDSVNLKCGLKPLSRFVGLPVVEVDRSRIHELTAEQCRAYVASDAHLARELVHRRWATALLTLPAAEVQRLSHTPQLITS